VSLVRGFELLREVKKNYAFLSQSVGEIFEIWVVREVSER